MAKTHADLDQQILSEFVIDVLADNVGYIPAPNFVPDVDEVRRKQPLNI
jgi:hypothetical protein